ncbi:MAG: DUF3703 domain-containing protein [Bacteroidetes bacterium]|nr:DUF3703 domain-containing protein [Bacteroidota bacterium]
MQINTTMPGRLKPFFTQELEQAALNFSAHNLQQSWRHLERAHIIGQPYPYEHSLVHWKMLQFGVAIKDTQEVLGQLPRLLVGGVKSFVGTIPVGNTGGANVPPLKPMEIPADLQDIISQHS